MDNNKNKQELVDRYLSGQMDHAEKTAFEELLINDQQLQEEVELSRHIVSAFQHIGEQKAFEAMKSISEEDFNQLISTSKTMKRGKKRSLSVVWISIAATAAIIVLLYIGWSPKYSSDKLYADYYITQPYDTYPRRGGSDLSIEEKVIIQQAKDLYEQKEYARTLSIYNQFLNKPDWKSQPEEILFYAAICQLEVGQTSGSIEKLAYLTSSDQFEFQEEALWNLTFAYLKENQRNKANDCLLKLINKDGDYADKAKILKENLNKKLWF